MKKIFLSLVILLTYVNMYCQSTMEIISSNNKQLQIKVKTAPSKLIDGIEYEDVKYQKINDVNCQKFAEGEPDLPALSYWITTPNDANISVTVEKGTPIVIKNVILSPVPKEVRDGEDSEFTMNNEIYSKNSFFPQQNAECEAVKNLRKQSCTILWIYPYQYNPIQKELVVYEELTVSVSFEGNSKIPNNVDEYTYKVLNRMSINTNDICSSKQTHSKPRTATTQYEYVIISSDELKSAGEKLALWKNIQGIRTKHITTSEINSTYNNCNDSLRRLYIKNYIANMSNTSDSTVHYILLLGDVNTIPTNYGLTHPYNSSTQGKIATDLYYFDIDNPIDYVADYSYGRLPFNTLLEANEYINKLIRYESVKHEVSSYYNTVLLAAQFQDNDLDSVEDRRFTKTANDIYTYLSANGYTVNREYYANSDVYPKYWSNSYIFENDTARNIIPINLQKPNYPWSANSTTVSNRINNGAFMVFHRDHGAIEGWGHPYFRNSHVQNLQNGTKYPIVFSLNCETGWFDTEADNLTYSNGNCFVEEWIRKQNGGAIGVVAATRVSYSGYNDRFAWGLMDAIWPNFIEYHHGNYGNSAIANYKMGDVLNYARTYLSSKYANNAYRKITLELFHYFGDPTMEIWTANPQEFTNVTITESSNNLTINTGVPNCTVCVHSLLDNGSSYYEVQNGQVVSFSNVPKPYMVSIKKHNYIPYFYTQDVYIQNYTFTENAMIVGRNIYIGQNVTTSLPQGPVIINNGVNVYFKPTENIYFNSGFEVQLGGTFEVLQD